MIKVHYILKWSRFLPGLAHPLFLLSKPAKNKTIFVRLGKLPRRAEREKKEELTKEKVLAKIITGNGFLKMQEKTSSAVWNSDKLIRRSSKTNFSCTTRSMTCRFEDQKSIPNIMPIE